MASRAVSTRIRPRRIHKLSPSGHGEVALGEVLGFEVGEPEHRLVGEALDGLLLNHLESHS